MQLASKHFYPSKLTLDQRPRPIRQRHPLSARSSSPFGPKATNADAAHHRQPNAWICWVRAVWSGLSRLAARRRDAEQLRDLPDYLLRDLGISRYEIEDAVHCDRLGRRRPWWDTV